LLTFQRLPFAVATDNPFDKHGAWDGSVGFLPPAVGGGLAILVDTNHMRSGGGEVLAGVARPADPSDRFLTNWTADTSNTSNTSNTSTVCDPQPCGLVPSPVWLSADGRD